VKGRVVEVWVRIPVAATDDPVSRMVRRFKAEAQRRFPGLSVTLKTSDALLILAACMEGKA